MRYVKNLAGLAIVLGAFVLMFLIFLGATMGGFALTFGGHFSLVSLAIIAIGTGGMFMTGGVLWMFVRNFSLRELMAPDALSSRNDAPVALEIKYDGSKSRSYLVDSRNSPRSSNPKKLGRGVFIMQHKRGVWVEDKTVVKLIDGKESKIENIRDFDNKIHFDFAGKKGDSHTITVAAITEHTSDFDKKDSWIPLTGGPDVSKEKLSEQWADSLKKA